MHKCLKIELREVDGDEDEKCPNMFTRMYVLFYKIHNITGSLKEREREPKAKRKQYVSALASSEGRRKDLKEEFFLE